MLVSGLCLFGNNANLNTPYMAMPHSAVSGGSIDATTPIIHNSGFKSNLRLGY